MSTALAKFAIWVLAGLVGLWPAAGQAQTTVKYVHTDVLGSVVAITDAARNVIERREYEPYGQQLTPAVQDGPGYTGHVQDAATGLTYMQQRYYDPVIGRFLSGDPVTAGGSTGANFNRYWYANNNPYKFVDPDGRAPNQSHATGWNHVYYLLSGMNLTELGSSHAGGSYRYFYTSTYGWVDIHHFCESGGACSPEQPKFRLCSDPWLRE
jgi:RHS repeat-associated protein